MIGTDKKLNLASLTKNFFANIATVIAMVVIFFVLTVVLMSLGNLFEVFMKPSHLK